MLYYGKDFFSLLMKHCIKQLVMVPQNDYKFVSPPYQFIAELAGLTMEFCPR